MNTSTNRETIGAEIAEIIAGGMLSMQKIEKGSDNKYDWGSDMSNQCRDRFHYWCSVNGSKEADWAVQYDREIEDWDEFLNRICAFESMDDISVCGIENISELLMDSIQNYGEIQFIISVVKSLYEGYHFISKFQEPGRKFSDEVGVACWLLFGKHVYDERSFIGFGA